MKSLVRTLSLAALVAFAVPALAQQGGKDHGPGPGPGGPGGPGGERGITVAADGTALVSRHTAGTTTTVATHSITAISPAGATAWSWNAPAAFREVEIAGSLVIVSVAGTPATTTAAATPGQLVALNLASGTTAWTLTLDGEAGHVEPTPTGLLTVVTKVTAAATASTPPTVIRSLVSISAGGQVVWTVSLD